MTPLVAMTVTAGAASAPLKKPPVTQKIAPKSTVPFERSAFDVEDQEHAIIPGFPDARFWGNSEKGFLQATRVAMGSWLSLSFFFCGPSRSRTLMYSLLNNGGSAMPTPQKFGVVLVHGGFVDGSGWEDVYKILKSHGYKVSIVQNPTTSLADDVAATKLILDTQGNPTILVGHSYGGVVITEAGNHPDIAGLVYIAAFAPDKGESVSKLIANPAPGAPVPPILPPRDGFLFLDKAKFGELVRSRCEQRQGRVHGRQPSALGR